jgi:DNA-binding transcriptional LysR family regulator
MIPSLPSEFPAGAWFVAGRLKMRHLLLLAALDDESNLHRAAASLGLSQPAASKLLRELEEMLGVPLFERLPRGMRTTWYGEAVIRHARMALTSLNDAHGEVEALKAGRFGQVSIGAITAPGLTLLPVAVAQLRQQQPRLRVALQIETSDVLIERLLQGKLDLVVGRLSERHDTAALHYDSLVEEDVCAMVRPGHPMLTATRLQLRDLAHAAWIVPPPGSVLRHRFELMFQEEGFEAPTQLIETSALLFTTRMLQQSDLLAVVASDVGRYYAQHGMVAVLPLVLPCKMDAFGLITRTDRLPSPGARLMLGAIQAAALSVYGVRLAPSPEAEKSLRPSPHPP